jgi:hypothetical protein
MELTLFVNDNVRSSCHDRGFAPIATWLLLMSSFLFEREQTLLLPLPTQDPDSSLYLRQKERDFLLDLYLDPDPSIIKQNSKKYPDFYCLVTFYDFFFIFEE